MARQRKPKAERRSRTICVRVTTEEAAAIAVRAGGVRMTKGGYIRRGATPPAHELHRSAGLFGFEGAESLASPAVIPGVGWLPLLSGVGQARRRHVRDPVATAANAVAEHPIERPAEPVQRASRTAAGGGMEARDAGPSMYLRSRSGY